MPKVVRFEIRGATNVTKSFNTGDILNNQTSITCDRDPDNDLTLVLETDRGVASLKIAAEPSGFNKDLPVGTIISSYLNWTELQVVTKNNSNNPAGNLWSAKFSKWAPADGREVTNSGFQRITNQAKLPDLRGVFLRGLNQFDMDQPSKIDQTKKDPDDRIRGNYQPDAFKEHTHSYDHFDDGIIKDMSNDKDSRKCSYGSNKSDSTGPPSSGSNKDETRPKNVAINWYIRIN